MKQLISGPSSRPGLLHGLSRAPHIHVAISRNGRRVLTTQAHVNGHPKSTGDYILGMVDPASRQTVLVDFQPMAGGLAGELSAHFDVILGRTAL
jgi:protocatechuate 3,4-dioxygenase beta subunit